LQFIAGVFLVLAGLQTDEQEVRSLGDALSAILGLPFFGNFLLGVVAVGLVTYACSWSPSPATAALRRAMPSTASVIMVEPIYGYTHSVQDTLVLGLGLSSDGGVRSRFHASTIVPGSMILTNAVSAKYLII
jgi:hypothetical protein